MSNSDANDPFEGSNESASINNRMDELVVKLLGNLNERLNANSTGNKFQPAEHLSFFDINGVPQPNLLDAQGPTIGLRRLSDGSIELLCFASAEDAKNRRPMLKQSFVNFTNASGVVERRSIEDGAGRSLIMMESHRCHTGETKVLLNRGTQNTAEVVLRNGRPESIIIHDPNNGKILSGLYESGTLKSVTVNGNPVEPQAAKAVTDALSRVLENVCKKTGTPYMVLVQQDQPAPTPFRSEAIFFSGMPGSNQVPLRKFEELPDHLRSGLLETLQQIKENGDCTRALSDLLKEADRKGRLDDVFGAVNDKLREFNIRLVKVQQDNEPFGVTHFRLEIPGRQPREGCVRRSPEAVHAELEAKIDSLVQDLLDGNQNVQLKAVADLAAKHKQVDEFRDYFNRRCHERNLNLQLADVTPPNGIAGRVELRLLPARPNVEVPNIRWETVGVGIGADPLPAHWSERVSDEYAKFVERFATPEEARANRERIIESLKGDDRRESERNNLEYLNARLNLICSKSSDEVEAHLNNLVQMAKNGNQAAQNFLDDLENQLKKSSRSAEGLNHSLRTLEGASRAAFLENVQSISGTESELLDATRVRAIIERVKVDDPLSLMSGEELLRLEEKNGNNKATKEKLRLGSELACVKLSSQNDQEFAEGLNTLSKNALAGDTRARDVLARVLLPEGEGQRWRAVNQSADPAADARLDKRILPADRRERAALIAAETFQKLANGEGAESTDGLPALLTRSQSMAIAMAFRKAVVTPTENRLASILRRTIRAYDINVSDTTDKDYKTACATCFEGMLTGLHEAILLPGDKSAVAQSNLVREYCCLMQSSANSAGRYSVDGPATAFEQQTKYWCEKLQSGSFEYSGGIPRSGDAAGQAATILRQTVSSFKSAKEREEAIAIVTAICAQEGHAGCASKAMHALLETARQRPDLRPLIMEELARKSKGLTFGGERLPALGKIIALSPQDTPDHVRDRFRETLISGSPSERCGAIKGLLCIGDALSEEERRLVAVCAGQDERLAQIISSAAHTLSAELGADITRRIASTINDTRSASSKLIALRCLESLAPFHATESMWKSLEKLAANLRSNENELGKSAANTLLKIAENAINQGDAARAINILQRHNWGDDFRKDLTGVELSYRLHKLSHQWPASPTIQFALRMLIGAEADNCSRAMPDHSARTDMARLAACFRDRNGEISDELLMNLTARAVQRYGKETVELMRQRLAIYNSLPGEDQQKLGPTGSNSRIFVSSQRVLLLMAEGNVEHDPVGRVLLTRSLEKDIATMLSEAKTEASRLNGKLKAHYSGLEESTDNLVRTSVNGVGFIAKLEHEVRDGKFTRFLLEQGELLKKIKGHAGNIEGYQREFRDACVRVNALELAKVNADYVNALRSCRPDAADTIALDALAKYGLRGIAGAPDIYEAVSSTASGVNAGVLARANTCKETVYNQQEGKSQIVGKTQFAELKINRFAGEMPSDLCPGGAESGLELLKSIAPKVDKGGDGKPIYFADAPYLRAEGLHGIDMDPAMAKMRNANAALSSELSILSAQFNALSRGNDRGQHFIADARERSHKVRSLLVSSLTREDIARLEHLRVMIERSLESGAITDKPSREALAARLEEIKSGLMVFSDADFQKLYPGKQARIVELYTQLQPADTEVATGQKQSLSAKAFELLLDNVNPMPIDLEMLSGLLNAFQGSGEKGKLAEELRHLNGQKFQRRATLQMCKDVANLDPKYVTTAKFWAETEGKRIVAGTALAVALARCRANRLIPGGFLASDELLQEADRIDGKSVNRTPWGSYFFNVPLQDKYGGLKHFDEVDLLKHYSEALAIQSMMQKGSHILGGALGRAPSNALGGALAKYSPDYANRVAIRQASAAELARVAPGRAAMFSTLTGSVKFQLVHQAIVKVTEVRRPGDEAVRKGLHDESTELNHRAHEFLTLTLASAAMRGMRPTMPARINNYAHRVVNPDKVPADLKLLYSPVTKEAEAAYFKDAKARGAHIKVTENGFYEIAKNGAVVEWTRTTANNKPFVAQVELLPARSAASITTGGAAQRASDVEVRGEVPPPNPQTAKRLAAELHEMLEPVRTLERQVAELEGNFSKSQAEQTKRLRELPQTERGFREAVEIRRNSELAKNEHEQQKAELQRQIAVKERELKDSVEFRQRELALAVAEGHFPAGDFMLKVPGRDQTGVKLTIGSMMVESNNGNPQRRPIGEAVPAEHVNQILREVLSRRGNADLTPNQITIVHLPGKGIEGGLSHNQGIYEITINSGSGQPVKLIYHHETGHLYDYAVLRAPGNEALRLRIETVYRECLESGRPARAAAEIASKKPNDEFVKSFNAELGNRTDFLASEVRSGTDIGKYFGSRGELFAEMFKLYKLQNSEGTSGGRRLTYDELISKYVEPHSPQRALMMRGFERMYDTLSSEVFGNIKPTSVIRKAATSELGQGKANAQNAFAPVDTVQSVKVLLDTKSATSGDSLHPSARGANDLRKKYESKLEDGSLQPSDVRRLLELTGEARKFVDIMIGSGRLSQAGAEQLLKLEPKSIAQLGNLTPRVCTDVVFVAIERGLVPPEKMNGILLEPEAQRKVALNFIETAMKDPGARLWPESVRAYLDLPHAHRADIMKSLQEAKVSLTDINLALSVPVRQSKGAAINDAPAMVHGMKTGVISSEQVKSWGSLEESARSGLATLIKSDALSKSSASKLFDMIKNGELKVDEVQTLSAAQLRGWLPNQTLEKIIQQEPLVRNALIRRIAQEEAKGTNSNVSVSDIFQKISALHLLHKQGVITEKSLHHLAEEHPSDLVMAELIKSQSKLGASERLPADKIQKLIELCRSNEISSETLEAYRSNLHKGVLSAKTVDAILSQSAEVRRAAEMLMKTAPQQVSELVNAGRLSEAVGKISPPVAETVFREMHPEGGRFEFIQPPASKGTPGQQAIDHFMLLMSKGDYKGALKFMESKTVTPEQKSALSTEPEIRWIEKKIALADLNSASALTEMHNFMLRQGKAEGTQTLANNPNSVQKMINVADPVIELPCGKQFRLRDSGQIYENQQWRRATAQEKAFIEEIQGSPAGKALLGKTAMIVMEEWGHTQQGTTGGISRLTAEFQTSPEFEAMKNHWRVHRGLTGKALDAAVNEALREIDIVAAVRESGLSTRGVRKLFGNLHVEGEREFFYRFLAKAEETARLEARVSRVSPSAAKLAGLDNVVRDRTLTTQDGRDRLSRAETLTRVETLPDNLRAEVFAFLHVGATGLKAQRLVLADHLVAVYEKDGSEACKKLLDVMRKVCDIEADRAARPPIPKMTDIFKPHEMENIRRIAEAQDALKPAELSREACTQKAEEFYRTFAAESPGGAPAQEKVLHLVVGPPGAGKTSTLVAPLARDYKAMVVDSDRIKPTIEGYTAQLDGKPHIGLGTNAVHFASGQIASDVLLRAMRNGDNIVHPILGRTPEGLIDIVMMAKANGYRVALHMADVPPEVAARRVYERGQDAPDEKGMRQMVSPTYAIAVAGYDPHIVFERVIKFMPEQVESWSYAYTNVPRGQQPINPRKSQYEIPRPR